MDETEVIDGESWWSRFTRLLVRHEAIHPTDVENDEANDSGSSLAELKGNERDDQEGEEKPGSSVAELRGGESSSPPADAKGDHSDSEHGEKTEM